MQIADIPRMVQKPSRRRSGTGGGSQYSENTQDCITILSKNVASGNFGWDGKKQEIIMVGRNGKSIPSSF